MARFLALLLIGPWLVVLGWLYWLYVRRRATHGVPARFDVGVLIAAALATIAGTAIGYEAAFGHADSIWQQVAAALGAYAGFNAAVLFGLVRHWQARRRAGVAAPQRSSR